MNASKTFFDTYVLLHLLSGDATKADRAEQFLADGGVISAQVLNEFASVGSRKRSVQPTYASRKRAFAGLSPCATSSRRTVARVMPQ